MRGITVSFGGSIIALRDIDFHVRAGEVVALLRDNGAGKSTLIKVLSGVQRPQSGSIWFSGEQVTLSSPQHARRLGVETVYQDLALIPLMSVARNFFLGREPLRRLGPLRLLDHVGMDRLACEALAGVGIDISDPSQPVGRLSGGERQSIAIARAVHFDSRILVFDEPTSALSIGETRKVLGYARAARDRGLLASSSSPTICTTSSRLPIVSPCSSTDGMPAATRWKISIQSLPPTS
ncbi:MAG: ATP-binding cassette domain-containing protein [Candidatus Latescibacterota bacterium]